MHSLLFSFNCCCAEIVFLLAVCAETALPSVLLIESGGSLTCRFIKQAEDLVNILFFKSVEESLLCEIHVFSGHKVLMLFHGDFRAELLGRRVRKGLLVCEITHIIVSA
jgi:hypothetical protein